MNIIATRFFPDPKKFLQNFHSGLTNTAKFSPVFEYEQFNGTSQISHCFEYPLRSFTESDFCVYKSNSNNQCTSQNFVKGVVLRLISVN